MISEKIVCIVRRKSNNSGLRIISLGLHFDWQSLPSSIIRRTIFFVFQSNDIVIGDELKCQYGSEDITESKISKPKVYLYAVTNFCYIKFTYRNIFKCFKVSEFENFTKICYCLKMIEWAKAIGNNCCILKFEYRKTYKKTAAERISTDFG